MYTFTLYGAPRQYFKTKMKTETMVLNTQHRHWHCWMDLVRFL